MFANRRIKKLSIRAFDRSDALAAYEKQNHKCAIYGEAFEFEEMHADHIKAWSKGGHAALRIAKCSTEITISKKEINKSLFAKHLSFTL